MRAALGPCWMCPFAVGTFCALFVPSLKKRAVLVKVVCGTPDACTHTLTGGVVMLWIPFLTIETLRNWPIITASATSVPIVMGWDAFFVRVSL